MKTTIPAVTIFVSLFTLFPSVLGQDTSLTLVDTPTELVQCEETEISWAGGSWPYTVQILYADNSTVIETLGTTSAVSVPWVVNVAAGTSVEIAVTDVSNTTVQSAALTVSESNRTICL